MVRRSAVCWRRNRISRRCARWTSNLVRDDGQYFVDHIVDGDTVGEVLQYVQYSSEDLLGRLRRIVERSLRTGRITFRESAQLLRSYEEGLKGYTYLAPDGVDDGGVG